MRGVQQRDRRRRAEAALERVGLAGRYGSRPAELSGGEAQRVAVARAIISDPKLLIFDEPTSALDVSIQAQVLNLLLDIRNDLGCAILFISHDLGVVNVMCDRVLVMKQGEIVEGGPTRQILDRPEHAYTAALVGVASQSSLTPKAQA
jgi:peptide/nickel transport system ATP-binding protein